jgi:hypothetical protein
MYFGVYNHGRPSKTAAAWLALRKTYFISVSSVVTATRTVLLLGISQRGSAPDGE